MAITRNARRALGACAVAVGVWTVLVSLFAMHGLPMQAPGSMAMSAPAAATTHGHAAGPSGVSLTDLDKATGSAAVSDPAQACDSSDHCTATLRTVDAAPVPAVIDVVSRAVDPSSDATMPVAPMPTARPPDLDTLQISRT